MICNQCGTEISDNAKFCPKCGKEIGNQAGKDSTETIKQDSIIKRFFKTIGNIGSGFGDALSAIMTTIMVIAFLIQFVSCCFSIGE